MAGVSEARLYDGPAQVRETAIENWFTKQMLWNICKKIPRKCPWWNFTFILAKLHAEGSLLNYFILIKISEKL